VESDDFLTNEIVSRCDVLRKRHFEGLMIDYVVFFVKSRLGIVEDGRHTYKFAFGPMYYYREGPDLADRS
jgi:hypothetical protein